MEQFHEYFDLWYLLAIVLGGEILTNDAIIAPLHLGIRGVLCRVATAWRILIYSALLGVAVYFLFPETGLKKIILTYLLANSVYALLAKALFAWITRALETFITPKQ